MLKDKIAEDFKKALKGRKELELSVLKLLKADILNKEKEKRYALSKEKPELKEGELEQESSLEEQEIIDLIGAKIKKSNQAIADFTKGERNDLVEKEKKEIEILKGYLPEQLSEEELKKIIEQAIVKTGAKEVKDMGQVMKEIMLKTKGKADGSLVSKIVKDSLR